MFESVFRDAPIISR